MSKLAKCLCGLCICTSTVVSAPVSNICAENVTSNQIVREAKEDSEISHNVVLKTIDASLETDKVEEIATLKHGQVVGVGNSNLRIRKEPNLDAEVEYGLFNGMTFDILSRVGDWYKITHYKTTGYVYKDYVEEYDEVPPHKVYEAPKVEIKKEVAAEVKQKETTTAKVNTVNTEVATAPKGRAIKAELTAYCNCSICTGQWGGQTAMGTTTRVGVVAVPKSIPLGSKIYIPGLTNYKSDGIFHAEDRGGAIVVKSDGTYHIDVWMPTHEQALKFGRQQMTVYLMD